jgi:hypothetical protein
MVLEPGLLKEGRDVLGPVAAGPGRGLGAVRSGGPAEGTGTGLEGVPELL